MSVYVILFCRLSLGKSINKFGAYSEKMSQISATAPAAAATTLGEGTFAAAREASAAADGGPCWDWQSTFQYMVRAGLLVCVK